MMDDDRTTPAFNRRDFCKTAAAASVAAVLPGSLGVFARGSDAIKVGVIGCGGRGTGATLDCLTADPGVEVVALGDLVPDRVESALEKLKSKFPDRVKVPANRCFTGFDNYLGVLSCPDVNLIVTATPPRVPPHPPQGGNRGRQARLHGETRRRRSRRRPVRDRDFGPSGEKRSGNCRRHAAAPPGALPGA